MKQGGKASGGLGALQLLEEAIALFRSAPVFLLGIYYLGSMPFVLAFLYFWAEMSRGLQAREHCLGQALALAFLFCVMKAAHAMFAGRLRRFVSKASEPAWSWRRAGRVLLVQGILQPVGLVLLPLAGLAVVPFANLYAYYVLLGAFAEDAGLDLKSLRSRAWAAASSEPLRNAVLVWLACPWILFALFLVAWLVAFALVSALAPLPNPMVAVFFIGAILFLLALPFNPLCMVLFLNFGVALILAPALLLALSGMESMFSISGGYFFLNSTFAAATLSLVYLTADPLLRAAFTLKGFYAESRKTGEDLRARLAEFRDSKSRRSSAARLVTMAAFLLLPACNGFCRPQAEVLPQATISLQAGVLPALAAQAWGPKELDEAAAQVLERREYRWRLPRNSGQYSDESVFDALSRSRLVAWMRRVWNKLEDWYERWRERHGRKELQFAPRDWLAQEWLVYLAFAVLGAALLFFVAVAVVRAKRRAGAFAQAEAVGPAAAFDLEREQVDAASLPHDEWMKLAEQLMNRGEIRLALRAIFLSGLSFLASRGLLRLAPAKTNLDYARELLRFNEVCPDLVAAFHENTGVFDRVWYGRHQLAPEAMTRFAANMERIRENAPDI